MEERDDHSRRCRFSETRNGGRPTGFRRVRPWWAWWVAPLLLVCLATPIGCRTPALEALRGPSVESEVSHFPGSILSGRTEGHQLQWDTDTVWGVKLAVFALASLPETELESAAPEIELITAERGSEPIAAHPRLGTRGRIGSQDDPSAFIAELEEEKYGPSASFARLVGVLPRGVTTVFRFTEQGGKIGELRLSRTAGEPTPRADALRLALVLEGFVLPEEEDELTEPDKAEERRRPPQPVLQREVILLRPRPPSRGTCLFLPSPFKSSPASALALVLETRPAAEWADEERSEFQTAVSRCQEDLARAGDRLQERKIGATNTESIWHGLAVALQELDVPSRRRKSLIFLAHTAQARLAEDLALAAPEALVAELAKAISLAASEEAPDDEGAVEWLLTQVSYRLLAKALSERQATPSLEGLLALHAGEVGRHGLLLQELLNASTGLEDFKARLIQENLTYLEDISPASRSRAFRWLDARGLAPEAYDPLGTVTERRAALAPAAETAKDTNETSQ